MRILPRVAIVILALGIVTHANLAQAQLDVLLESWEAGVGNWTTAVSNGSQVSGGASLATSGNGATDGASSLAITQFGDTTELDPIFNSVYSYDAEVRYLPGDAQLDALNTAFDIGAQHFELRYDVTYVAADIPGGNSISTGVGLEGGGAPFNTVDGLADFDLNFGGPSELLNVAQPLTDWTVPQTGGATFFDISFGLNGNWGGGGAPAIVYVDNLRLVQTSEPALLTLEINRETGATRIVNENTAGNIVEFNYYEIDSPQGALDPDNWEPLDDFLIPDEGWTQAGGSSEFDLTEANFLSFSDLDGSESFSLGNAFTPGGNESGLAFRYREPSRPGALREGLLSFLGDPPTGCDFDQSGACDGTDINLLVAEIVAGTNGDNFDLNGDNVVTLADITDAVVGWLAQAGEENIGPGRAYLVGDANLDGIVDGLDFIDWNANKFTALAEWTGGDFNADGIVDGLDFIEWNANKFTGSDAVTVPEPAGLSIAMIALFVTGHLRRLCG